MEGDQETFTPEALRREFDAIDSDGNGSLDADELHDLFLRLGKDLKRGTIANLIRLADDDGNGTLEWEEFSQIFDVVARMKKKADEEKSAEQNSVAESPSKAVAVIKAGEVAMGA